MVAMNKLLPFVFFLFAMPAFAQDCGNLSNVYESGECYEKQLAQTDRKIQQEIRTIQQMVRKWNPKQENSAERYTIDKPLAESQAAWKAYVEKDCNLSTLPTDSFAQGGGSGMVMRACFAEYYLERLKFLRGIRKDTAETIKAYPN